MEGLPESSEILTEKLLREVRNGEFRVDDLPAEVQRRLFVVMVETIAELAMTNAVEDPEKRVQRVERILKQAMHKVKEAIS